MRTIKQSFHTGTDKISTAIKFYKRTGTVLRPPKRGNYKLTTGVLAEIHIMIFNDAHVTLQQMRKSIEERLHKRLGTVFLS